VGGRQSRKIIDPALQQLASIGKKINLLKALYLSE
jgi:hypothetical protein